MRIKQLYIHNITSIEDGSIDFDAEPLKSSDLFLISGDIGSGKSTILDSICLALYGTTPRINMGYAEKIEANADNLTGRDPRQLMRQNSGEAFVRLVFEGTDGNQYEMEWQVQRGLLKKPTSALSKDVWTLHNLTTGELLTGSTNKDYGIREAVQKAVGLNFEQFCRTTILAQGEFTKFLKSDEKEKAAILEKITGTGIYSKIGAKIYEWTKNKRDALKTETDNLKDIQPMSEEQRDAKTSRLKAIETENAVLMKTMEQAMEARRDLKEVEDSQKEIQRLDQEIEQRLKQRYLLGLKGKKGLEEVLRGKQSQRKAVADRIESQQEKAAVYEQSQTILQLLRNIYRAKQQIQEKTKENPALGQAGFQQAYSELATALKADEEQMKAKNLPGLRTQKEALNKAVGELQNLLTRLDTLKHQNQKLKELEQQNKQLWAEVEQLEQTVPGHQERLEAGKKLLSSLEALKDLSAKTVDQWAKQIRSTLKEGCTCPVCQQTLQQALPVESELDQAYQENLRQYQTQKTAVDDLSSQLNKLVANIEAKKKQHALNAGNLTKSQAELQHEAGRFLEDAGKHDIQALPEATEKLKTLKQAKEDEAFQLGLHITEAEGFEKQVNEKKNRLAQLASLADLEKSIDEVGQEVDGYLGKKALWPLDWRNDMTTFANLLKDEAKLYLDDKELVKELERQLKETDKTLQDVSDVQSKILVSQPDWKDLEMDGTQAVERLEAYWNELYSQLDTTLQLKAVAVQKQQKAQQQLAALEIQETPDALDAKITEVEQRINALKEESALISKELETDAAQRKSKEELQQRIAAMTEDYALWKRLCDQFGNADGSLFQKIAQSFILGNLLHTANRYLKSLHPRYSLEVIPGTLHISLVDAYQGYATRFVSSLSGGESFLVSLSLALALSDIGQNLAVETLFIDEGFGSLSGVELSNAINTLRALHRSNGRRVGIISHVESVIESIPVQIQVLQKQNHTSSEVKVEVMS